MSGFLANLAARGAGLPGRSAAIAPAPAPLPRVFPEAARRAVMPDVRLDERPSVPLAREAPRVPSSVQVDTTPTQVGTPRLTANQPKEWANGGELPTQHVSAPSADPSRASATNDMAGLRVTRDAPSSAPHSRRETATLTPFVRPAAVVPPQPEAKPIPPRSDGAAPQRRFIVPDVVGPAPTTPARREAPGPGLAASEPGALRGRSDGTAAAHSVEPVLPRREPKVPTIVTAPGPVEAPPRLVRSHTAAVIVPAADVVEARSNVQPPPKFTTLPQAIERSSKEYPIAVVSPPAVVAPTRTQLLPPAAEVPPKSPAASSVVTPRARPPLPLPPAPLPVSATAPVDVRIGTIEIRLAPVPPAPVSVPPNEPAPPVDFDAYARLRRYDAWER